MIDFIHDALTIPHQYAVMWAMLGGVVMFAFIVCVGQFVVMLGERHTAERRIRDLKPLSDRTVLRLTRQTDDFAALRDARAKDRLRRLGSR